LDPTVQGLHSAAVVWGSLFRILCMNDTQAIRRQIRQHRRALNSEQQFQASKALSRRITQSLLFLRSKRIALYLPNDGEIDPTPIAEKAWSMRKQIFLPVLHESGDNQLRFVYWEPDTPFTQNRFGIAEPVRWHSIPTWSLDLILLPLVAFDNHARRIGMGGGFYDKSLAFTRQSPLRPTLIGLAHECQRIEHIEAASWDVPLQGIVTDCQWYYSR
jgi:5-formyltetrahydrofolate cyclo-ligase